MYKVTLKYLLSKNVCKNIPTIFLFGRVERRIWKLVALSVDWKIHYKWEWIHDFYLITFLGGWWVGWNFIFNYRIVTCIVEINACLGFISIQI